MNEILFSYEKISAGTRFDGPVLYTEYQHFLFPFCVNFLFLSHGQDRTREVQRLQQNLYKGESRLNYSYLSYIKDMEENLGTHPTAFRDLAQ